MSRPKVAFICVHNSCRSQIAEALGIKPRQLCIALRAVAFLGNGDPVYYQQIFIPPNERELHVVSDSRAAGYLA